MMSEPQEHHYLPLKQEHLSTLYRRVDNQERGRHLVACCRLSKDSLIFVERPLVSLQSVGNSHAGALVCRCCRAFCGGPPLALAIASGRVPRAQATCFYNSVLTRPQQEKYPLVACRHDCGEVYCSQQCEQDMWVSGGHGFLCTGNIPEDCTSHPLLEFKIYAVQNNEIFLMVADVIAAAISATTTTPTGSTRSNTHFLDPHLDFTMVPWWTVATEPLLRSPMGFAEAAQLDATLKQLCETSSTLLRQALQLRLNEHEQQQNTNIDLKDAFQQVDELCTADFFSKLIGSFEQNAMGIQQRHPLCRDIFQVELRRDQKLDVLKCMERAGMIGENENDESLDDQKEGAASAAASAMPLESDKDPLETLMEKNDSEYDYTDDEIAVCLADLDIDEQGTGDDLDSLFTPFDGTAMYAMACKMNHSCDPNVVVLYKPVVSWGMPLLAHCVALRDIEEGEELCISYIASTDDLSARQDALANYGFTCECIKCQRETYEQESKPSVGSTVESDNDDDEDDLVGNDEDCDADELDQNVPHGDDQEENGESLLQRRLDELNLALNASEAGAIPSVILAVTCDYVIETGTGVFNIIKEQSDVHENLLLCEEAVRNRDFISCASMGSLLEQQLYGLLQCSGSWAHAVYREAYGCSALTAAIGHAHMGHFLAAQLVLDKAVKLGLPRKRVSEFLDYVKHFALEAASSPYQPGIDCKL